MHVLFLLISFFTSLTGSICGIGGGVIIKPLFDSFGVLDVASISFLSGCTVLSMSAYSVIVSMIRNDTHLNIRIATWLAIGAAAGGVIGKYIFNIIWLKFENTSLLGLIQAICLVCITVGTLLYMIFKSKIHTYRYNSLVICVLIGLFLGLLSSFLGIGGGPVNLVVLYYFFSMEAKKAAENSLYIILFSQTASLLNSVISRTVPSVDLLMLILMVLGGVSGCIIGKWFNKKIDSKFVEKLFICMMAVIICINIFNIIRFSIAY